MPPRREGEGGGPLTLRKGRLGSRCCCSGSRGRGGAGEVAGGDAASRRPAEGPCEGVGRNWGRGAAKALCGVLRSGGGVGRPYALRGLGKEGGGPETGAVPRKGA